MTSIGESAFAGCMNLYSVEIPNSVTSIGKFAFYNCMNLYSVKIPSSVMNIGESAFLKCSRLTYVYIYNMENVLLAANGACPFKEIKSDCLLYVPENMKPVYEGTNYADVFSRIVGMDAETVDIGNIGAENALPVTYYNMNGCKYDTPQRGVNVVCYSDGTVRKVMVK
ncbi:MAG: leucine-rich repeat domain-containing protein [Prevotellaceae bacterium]|nr:leucine-rich repeat domain-containing protein [Prevotellaceae bacterium]